MIREIPQVEPSISPHFTKLLPGPDLDLFLFQFQWLFHVLSNLVLITTLPCEF